VQHELVVIPKSARRERILENADVSDFQLSAADIQALDGLSRAR
jgi:diketogulonate reductase-like aldo/keto reductase